MGSESGDRTELLARRERIAEEVRQMIRDVDYWNRNHPNETPLSVADEAGALASSLKAVGLGLSALEREARDG